MNTPSRSWHAPERPAEITDPLPGLVELLLDLLLQDVPGGLSAQVSLSTGDAGEILSEETDFTARQVGDPEAGGHLVSACAPLADGATLTLAVRAERRDDALTPARLQRFVRPIVACLALERRSRQRAHEAREAVAAIERLAVLDLATGIMMARRDCNPQTARGLVAAWSADQGVDLQTLTPADVLGRLTAG